MRKTFFILPLVFFLIFGIFFYLLSTDRNPSEIPSNLLNKTVPIFEAESLFKNEKFISLNEFKDEITLVNFFATWCKPCRDEHIYIKRFADQKNIKVIGINYKDNQKKTKKWLNDLGNPYKDILIDQNGNIAIDCGVYGIPETFIINSNGIIKYRHVGPITEKEFKKINLLISQNE